ncbi:MAG: hypothetical protein IH614_18585, partial [Desulfuromonadales bacterium]|nr:hypothetical protein [Desulfuromonadales bacterium]
MVTSFRRILIGVLLLSLLAALAWVRQRPEAGEMLSRRQLVMGTVVEITAYGDDLPRLEAGIAEAMAEMVRREALLGPGAGSDLERLRHSTEPFEVAAETAEV